MTPGRKWWECRTDAAEARGIRSAVTFDELPDAIRDVLEEAAVAFAADVLAEAIADAERAEAEEAARQARVEGFRERFERRSS